MKYSLILLAFAFPILIGVACDSEVVQPSTPVDEPILMMKTTIKLKVGDQEFTATLFDNPSTASFKTMLPLTLSMKELNGNEKYAQLPMNLPTDASNPGTIHTGDILLWGSNTLAVFYETFSTSYNYTKIGKIDNPTGLAAAVGSSNVTVTIELP